MRVQNAVFFVLLGLASSFIIYFQGFDGDDNDKYATPSVSPEILKQKIEDKSIALVVVIFYTSWCRICHRVMPVFDKSAKSLESHSPKIFFCRMNILQYQDYAYSHGVEAYPSMRSFDNEGNIHNFDDPILKVPAVVNWIKPLLLDDYVIKSADDIDRCLHDNDLVVIGLFENKEQNEVFKQTAASFNGLIFSSSVDEKVSKEVATFLEKHHEHKCEVVDIGPTKTNGVTRSLSMEGLDCSEIPANLQHPLWTDVFGVNVTGTIVTVRRTDEDTGWLQKLQLSCCVHLSQDQHKNDPISIPVPSVVMFTNFQNDKFIKYPGRIPLVMTELQTFVKSHKKPVVSFLYEETLPTLSSLNMPFAVLFINKETYDKDTVLLAEEAFNAAARHFDRAKIAAFIAKDDFERLNGFANIANADEDAPCIRILDPTPESKVLKYGFRGDVTSEEAIREFEKQYHAGEISSMLKSEPIPEEPQEEHAPRVVVGNTYAAITRNPKKDVFVVIYASWCGHCRLFMPTWDKLAEALAEEENIDVCKLDGTANEIEDFPVEGFPTVLLYPAEANSRPLPYEGDRTVNAMLRFLERQGKNKFKIKSEEEVKKVQELRLAQKRELRKQELEDKKKATLVQKKTVPIAAHKPHSEDL
eukprot:GEMP01020148.1.p1 GENE.GEMP01020148.1~~GEMP01020148.1.p1  ORF type:complete len:641 (+),score=139.87 GEMP01020148.1:222-2144(+)